MKISLSLLQDLFGYCPQCGAPVTRRVDDQDQCANGHMYPSDETIPPSDNHYEVGQKVRVMPKRKGYALRGVVVEMKNDKDLIGVQIAADSATKTDSYIGYFPKSRLQKV